MLEYPQVAVHNLHYNAAPVAEMVLALLLSAAKFIVPLDRSLRGNDWSPRYEPSRSLLLEGKTALILGYGEIGQRVARMCHGLGMRVLVIRRSGVATENGKVEIHPAGELEAVLPQADALLITLPHTPETDGLIGQNELALLPSEAVLVNIGRGGIVDEGALYRALKDGIICAAGLDVWYNYPAEEDARTNTPPSSYPFQELDNVVMSPHRAGHSRETDRLRMEHLAELLNTAARGEDIPNKVDLDAGY
jgi:phosphoglycerate dehydrogenase-like enzyme